MHPDGTAHGGSAILIKSNIKHHEYSAFSSDHIQATAIEIEDRTGPIVLAAVYSPPKHNIKKEHYLDFFSTLDKRFIAAGDYNAKHTFWSSRTILSKGRELMGVIDEAQLEVISSGEPTYWPTDRKRLPDLLDFAVVIAPNYLGCVSCLELSSDLSPILITLSTAFLKKAANCTLHNNRTNWDKFRDLTKEKLNLKISLKNEDDITQAVEHLNKSLQQAAWVSTTINPEYERTLDYPVHIKEKVKEKRDLRKIWQTTRCPKIKKRLNYAIKELKIIINNETNERVQNYLKNLDATKSTEFSL